jgi:Domain of unknown function (DUF4352)
MTDELGKKPNDKRVPVLIAIATVVLAVGVFVALSSGSTGSHVSEPPSTDDAPAAAAPASNTDVPKQSTPGLNQAAEDDKFRFVATALTCGKTYLVNDNEFENATAQGQWCLLSLTYSNIGSEAQTFATSSQYVYDASGKQYSADSDGTMAANPSGSQCISYQQINPGVSSSCVVAFDVPKSVTLTYAVLHDSSVSDGVKVNLR